MNTYKITLIIIFTICAMLLGVEIQDLIKSIQLYLSMKLNYPNNLCLENTFIFTTSFTIIIILIISASIALVLCLFFFSTSFLNRILPAYLSLIYIFFGLFGLGFSIYCLIFWNSFAYVCFPDNTQYKIFSMTNATLIILTFIVSLGITVGYIGFDIFLMYKNSLGEKEGGIKIIKKIFSWLYWILKRNREGNNNNIPRENNNNNLNENSLLNNVNNPGIRENNNVDHSVIVENNEFNESEIHAEENSINVEVEDSDIRRLIDHN